MKALILGGTVFVGRAIVEGLQERGHEVTIFARGVTNPELFPEIERIAGDRDGDLRALASRQFDVVVDASGFVPRLVRRSAELLQPNVGRYIFISTASVYADMSKPLNEDSPVVVLPADADEDVALHYGALKAACECVVAEIYGDRATIIRPGLVVGPHDPTGRFTYWPRRIKAGGPVLAPGNPDAPVQFIDARDLARFVIQLSAAEQGGVFNAVGPGESLNFEQFLGRVRAVLGSDAEFVWIPSDEVLAAGVTPWSELPLWMPFSDAIGLLSTDASRARASGLRFRMLEETVLDTLTWDESVGGDPPRQEDGIYRQQTLARDREREILIASKRGPTEPQARGGG